MMTRHSAVVERELESVLAKMVAARAELHQLEQRVGPSADFSYVIMKLDDAIKRLAARSPK